MKHKLLTIYAAIASTVATISALMLPVFASPLTGDQRGQRMGLVIGLLVASAVLIVAVLFFTRKKGDKKK